MPCKLFLQAKLKTDIFYRAYWFSVFRTRFFFFIEPVVQSYILLFSQEYTSSDSTKTLIQNGQYAAIIRRTGRGMKTLQ